MKDLNGFPPLVSVAPCTGNDPRQRWHVLRARDRNGYQWFRVKDDFGNCLYTYVPNNGVPSLWTGACYENYQPEEFTVFDYAGSPFRGIDGRQMLSSDYGDLGYEPDNNPYHPVFYDPPTFVDDPGSYIWAIG